MSIERALELAGQAGEILLGYYGRIDTAAAERKGGRRRDLVSAADVASEQAILAGLPASDAVLAEEGGGRPGTARRWIVDPLDGTVNFLHGIPWWAVSIALEQNGQLVAAVVHAPALGLTFAAEAGGATRLNGVEVTVSATAQLADAILATGFPYARDTLPDNNLDNVTRIGRRAGGLRRMGAASLDLAFTAAGRLDGFWELHLEPWDVAAGVLLVRRAGGIVTDVRGEQNLDRVLFGRNLVATNGRLHEELCASLAPLRDL